MHARRGTIIFVLLSLIAAPPGRAAAAVTPGASSAAITEVPNGTVLSKDNWQIAQGHLPDEILELYKRGDYANPIRKIEGSKGSVYDPRLKEISQQNAGKFDIDEKGTVVDKTTGKRPPVIIGWPFPDIQASDPKAGIKATWNYLYTLHWGGSFHTVSPLNWVERGSGVTRRIEIDVHFKYYDGQPPEFQEKVGENPLNILNRTMGVVRSPADVQGIVSLNWRFREGDKADQAWTYVPALRRVRPINPANRADGFLGSDLSQDDGPYFDGKPEEFDFKLLGDGWVLATYDDKGIEAPSWPKPLDQMTPASPLVEHSDIGWRISYPQVPLIAAQEPEGAGKGLAPWAPLQVALVARPVWIVEAVPKNPYYLYGKQVMYFDKENFRGYWKSKYDWKGSVLMNYQVPESLFWKIDGPPGYMRISYAGGVAIVNNVKADRATVSGLPVADTDNWIDIPESVYETERIVRYGK
ncbi:MAG: DUF1329 domain-containing protein [Deltaproteobacteria bacterium]|nr:DUF1329 domain-containing protein [Deltaproteobacteria bacterium]